MPIIQVQILEGRDIDQIKNLIADLTDAAIKNLSENPEQVRVWVTEILTTHWGAGGITKSEISGSRK